ncbi:flavin reductase [Pseudonocardia sp. ICBG1122]|nr:flavin reductase [Pseudonocardia pini]
MSTTAAEPGRLSPGRLRHVLGRYPTGVCIVTGTDSDGRPVGMTVGTFTSVSLDPPLVAFLPGRESRTFAAIAEGGRFAVNVLADDQVEVCRRFASPGGDRFGSVSWRPSPLGSPVLSDAVAWIDCRLDAVHGIGDHLMVVGAVHDLDAGPPGAPLVFLQGGFGRFAELSLLADGSTDADGWPGAAEDADMTAHLRLAGLARPGLERLARLHDVQSSATALHRDQVIQLAWAGAPGGEADTAMIGLRLPFAAPFGLLFAAWAGDPVRRAWLRHLDGDDATSRARAVLTEGLATACDRGWTAVPEHGSLRAIESDIARLATEGPSSAAAHALHDHITAFAHAYAALPGAAPCGLSVPVFDGAGRVALVLTVHGLGSDADRVATCRADLLALGRELTARLRGTAP